MIAQILKISCILLFLIFTPLAYASDTLSAFPSDQSQDPMKNLNQGIYKMNDALDKGILKPVAKAYDTVTPNAVEKSVHNFFMNLQRIPSFINDILQVNLYYAAADLWRFTINSTVGIGGLFDVASAMDVPYFPNDFGLTLARWGWRESSYFIMPFWGPSTIRDAIALLPYYFMTVYPYIHPAWIGWTLLGVDAIDMRTQYLKLEDLRAQASFDPYVFQRNAYLQRRNGMIAKITGHPLKNDFEDELDDEDENTNSKETTKTTPKKYS